MTGMIVSLVAILGSLVLAVRAMRHRPGNRLLMAAAWLVIIVATVFIIEQLGGRS